MTLGSVRRPGFCADAPLVANRSRARPFFLVAALHLRLYADDPAGLTIVDFMHWLTWHRFAGVERVFVFDAHVKESERFGSHAAVRGAVDSGFLTYVDWGDVAKRNVRGDGSLRARHVAAVQLPAMVEAWRLARDEAKWMLFIDVDEYAQVPGAAAEPGFLARRVRDVGRRSNSRGRPVRVSQIVFPTVIFEGPRDAARGPMLAQQVSRARDARHNKSATKSAVRLDALAEVNVHRSSVDFGETVALDRSRAFVGHYHAGRTVGFKSWTDLDPAALDALLARTDPTDCARLCDRLLACFGRDEPPRLGALGPLALVSVSTALFIAAVARRPRCRWRRPATRRPNPR